MLYIRNQPTGNGASGGECLLCVANIKPEKVLSEVLKFHMYLKKYNRTLGMTHDSKDMGILARMINSKSQERILECLEI